MSSPNDRLESLFVLREEFMKRLSQQLPETYSNWPLDPTSKANQMHIRDIVLRGVEEMFEALQHLKNSKPHRQTNLPDFEREAFLEETVDAFNYFLSVLVLLGVDANEFHEAYKKKHDKIMQRLREGY